MPFRFCERSSPEHRPEPLPAVPASNKAHDEPSRRVLEDLLGAGDLREPAELSPDVAEQAPVAARRVPAAGARERVTGDPAVIEELLGGTDQDGSPAVERDP